MSQLYDEMIKFGSLYSAYHECKKGSDWKDAIQKFDSELLLNLNELHNQLRTHTYKLSPFNEFELNERGKIRYIKAVGIADRIVERTLCDHILPKVQPHLIYDNGASLKGKGIDFSRRRLATHLSRYYKENQSNEGYVLKLDFTKFFDNIPHKKLYDMFAKYIEDQEVLDLIQQILNTFIVDVSYMTDEEYQKQLVEPFDTLKYKQYIKQNHIDFSNYPNKKYLYRSMAIGVQLSQIAGVFYPTPIDQYCKTVKGLKYYGRYMDDIYIIHKDKQVLQNILNDIIQISKDLEIFVNKKKTYITKLSRGFTFLQMQYKLEPKGHIYIKPNPKSMTRERRKLKKYLVLLRNGKMNFKSIEKAFWSWRGNVIKYSNFASLQNIEQLYYDLFYVPYFQNCFSTTISIYEYYDQIYNFKDKFGTWKEEYNEMVQSGIIINFD